MMVRKMAHRDSPVVFFITSVSWPSRDRWGPGGLGIKRKRILSFRTAFLTSQCVYGTVGWETEKAEDDGGEGGREKKE